MTNVKRETGNAVSQRPKSALIILDGEINSALLKKQIKIHSLVISADGASDKLYRLKIIPDYIIGDLDSITPKALAHFEKNNVHIKKIAEQEHNDFEKCLQFALSKKIKSIIVIGYGGKRADHMLNNFSVMKKYYKKCSIKLVDNDFEIFFAGKSAEFSCKKGDTVSVLAMPKAEGITTRGLQYRLKNETLEFGIREGALNKAVSSKVKIEVMKGDLLIFKKR